MSLLAVERYEHNMGGAGYVDKSGSITTGGTAQTLASANAYRDHMFIGNPNASGSLWVNDLGGTAAANAAGSTEIVPGQTVTTRSRSAISIIHATTSAKFTSGEA